jgi:hypothetical protein
LYLGTIPRPDDNAPDQQDFVFLAKLYVLGEELMDVKFKNMIVGTIVAVSTKSRWSPIGEAVSIIYEGTSEGSPARRLVVNYCAHNGQNNPSWTDEFKNCPYEFLVDAMKAMVCTRPSPASPEGSFPVGIEYKSYHEALPGSTS